MQVLESKITQQRIKKHEKRLTKAIDDKGKKSAETTIAEETAFNRQEQSDNALINNLSLMDEVNYSTVSLQLYQKETIKRELVGNEKNTKAYEPGLLQKTNEAFSNGWLALETFLLFLINAWAFILIGALIFFLFKRFKRG